MDAELRELERSFHSGDSTAVAKYMNKVARMGDNALKAALRQNVLPRLSIEDLFALRHEILYALNSRYNLVIQDNTAYQSPANLTSDYLRKKNKDFQITDRKYKAERFIILRPSLEQAQQWKNLTAEEIFYKRLEASDIRFHDFVEIVSPSPLKVGMSDFHVLGVYLETEEDHKKRVKSALKRKASKLRKQEEADAKKKAEELTQLKKLLKKYPDAKV